MSRLSKVIVMLVVAYALTLIASWVKADWEAWLDKPLVIEEPMSDMWWWGRAIHCGR